VLGSIPAGAGQCRRTRRRQRAEIDHSEGSMAKKRSTSTRKKASGGRTRSRSTARSRRESGEPGGGQGRVDQVGLSGVYPRDASNIPGNAEVRMAGSWGGGDYNESGGSELVYREGQLLGGLTAGPGGEPTIDIHSNILRPRLPEHTEDESASDKE
jgi:hypothetical protein